MTKHDKTGRSKKVDRYVGLTYWMLATPAWRSLDPVARAAYVELKALYNGSNNGRLAWSVRDAAANLLVSPATVMRALQRLEERGFIAREKRGAFSRKIRHAAEWRLTEMNCDVTGELASKDFARWEGPKGAQVHVVKHQNSKHGARSETNGARGETLGARGETSNPENSHLGARGETSKGFLTPISGARGETHIIYQVGDAPLHRSERGRSAPVGSAEASPRASPVTDPSSFHEPSRPSVAAIGQFSGDKEAKARRYALIEPSLMQEFADDDATLEAVERLDFGKQTTASGLLAAHGREAARAFILKSEASR